MRERPILSNGPMVRAILQGRKTQTRRIIKPQPDAETTALKYMDDNRWRQYGLAGDTEYLKSIEPSWACPFQVDRLWVRETHCKYGPSYIYRADYGNFTPISDGIGGPWKPSIHMPRAACRLMLEITDIRVERLQDISEADAQAEGVERLEVSPKHLVVAGTEFPVHPMTSTYKTAFQFVWKSIYGPDSWEQNPWVWVVTFDRIEQT